MRSSIRAVGAEKNPLVQSIVCGSHRSVVGGNGIIRLDQRGRDGRTKISDGDVVFVGSTATLGRHHFRQIFRHVHDAQPGGSHLAEHRARGRAAIAEGPFGPGNRDHNHDARIGDGCESHERCVVGVRVFMQPVIVDLRRAGFAG